MKKLIATAVMGAVIALTPLSASAQYRSYYDMMSGWNQTSQVNFAKSMVRSYERTNQIYENFLTRYTRFKQYSWYQRMQSRYNFQVAEVAKFKAFLGQGSTGPTLVDTIVTEKPGQTSVRRPTVEASRNTAIVEEQTGNTVREYAVTTVIYETPVKTIDYVEITTTKVYSDGKRQVSTKRKLVSQKNTIETDTRVERELIREYAVVIDQPTDSPTGTMQILTEEEYLARDDVNLYQSDVYRTAVKTMNSRINSWYTDEVLSKTFGNNLDDIGAPAAWSRGYTGAGSKIAIFDTGIDMDHSEFEGRIAGAKCFTGMCAAGYETIDDKNRYSHGTHVAGLAAAGFDGKGMTGVAPEAELLIGKTAYDWGYFDFSKVDEAIEWAMANGADVMNISANMNVDRTYKNSLTRLNDGTYYANDSRSEFATKGYSNYTISSSSYLNVVDAMRGHEGVLVLAAGNQGMSIAGAPSNIALEDSVGERVLVVGNYDVRTNDLYRGSNAAGTVCFDKTGNSCADDKRISDRFIMAPGMYVASASANNGYRTLSGTSMAAPQVAGAVAVVRQMWPHMTGSNLTKLLLNTASTDEITNYNVERHGQGLLDLDEATKPQGAVGLPTTGRVDGATVSVQGGVLALNGTATISALENVMVVDEYDRDFYFDANSIMQVNDTRTASAIKAAQHGVQADNYIGFTGGQIVPMENVALAINDDTGDTTVAFTMDGFTFGVQNEKGSFLGNIADTDLMRVDGATTTYAGYQFDTGTVFGSAQLGATSLDVDSSTMMKDADTLISYSASLGAKRTMGNNTFGTTVSVPVTVATGKAHFEMPNSVSADGTLEYANMSSSLATQRQEIDYGVFFNSALTETSSIETFAELRTNYAGTNDNTVEVGISYKVQF